MAPWQKPWNNPFGKLKELAREAEREAEAAAKARAAERERERLRALEPPPPPPVRERSEAELWQEATAGARRIEPGNGVAAPRPPRPPGETFWHPDLEAVDELRALVSGDAPFDLSDSDEYIEGRLPGIDPGLVRKLRAGEFAVQGHVDLHGMSRAEAKGAVDDFLRRSRSAGKRCVLVVHGRGLHSKDQLPVLKDALKGWLATGRFARHVLAFASARPSDGGAGAVYVLLRRQGR